MTTTLLSPISPSSAGAAANTPDIALRSARTRILSISTIGFTLLFAVWLMFGILALPIRTQFKLTDFQFSLLTAIAILNGSIWRLSFGMLADRFGGRIVMTALLIFCAIPAFCVAYAQSYTALLLFAFLVGLAGNGFSIGIAWNSAWFSKQSQGTALGVFGAGNVGASITKLIGPTMIALVPAAGIAFAGFRFPGGWQSIPFIYAILLLVMAVITFYGTPRVDRKPGQGRTLSARLAPLASIRVWRFGLYYVVMFGAYVALSVTLPRYYKDIYHLSLGNAALLTALFIFPASLLRPVGGYLSDRFGARRAMYAVFALMTAAAFFLALPPFQLNLDGSAHSFHFNLGVTAFTILVFLLGIGMGIGKAAVYKYIPEYFPKDVGAVGGLVGALGGLGGFFLPLLFTAAESATHLPQMTFAVLFLLIAASFLWLHVVVQRMLHQANPQLETQFELHPAN